MKELGREHSVKVETYARICNPDPVLAAQLTDYHVAVGTPSSALILVMSKKYSNINMIVYDAGSELLNNEDDNVRRDHRKVQVVVCSENELTESLDLFRTLLNNPEVISSDNLVKKTLEGIKKHQFVVVENVDEKVEEICKIIVEKMFLE